ncbi:hypothetical protein TWF173_003329 [Orbilia oligospora]|nr:hypothetical protein TWF173_003329 [Orbilia oligospora]
MFHQKARRVNILRPAAPVSRSWGSLKYRPPSQWGDLRTGFEFELIERYDLENTNRRHTKQFLSEITVIQVARQTPTPGPSLRSTSYDGPKVRLSQQRNCQDWVIDVLEALESEELVQAGTRSQVKTQS